MFWHELFMLQLGPPFTAWPVDVTLPLADTCETSPELVLNPTSPPSETFTPALLTLPLAEDDVIVPVPPPIPKRPF